MKLVNENEKIIETIKCDGDNATKLILTDMNLYIVKKIFGEKRCVYLPTAKIDRLFFELNRNSMFVEVENVIYPIICNFKEKDLRLLCKKFKEIKKNRPLRIVVEDLFLSNIVDVLSDDIKKDNVENLSSEIIEKENNEEDTPSFKIKNTPESTRDTNDALLKQETEISESKETLESKATGTLHIKPKTITETESLFSDLEDKPKKGLFSLRKKK